jgi:hypothetical protein
MAPWRGRRATVGGIHKSTGYCRIGIDGCLYRSSRLAVLYMTGEWPKAEIDHVNCNKADDRWENLREATHAQNQRNDGQGTRPSASMARSMGVAEVFAVTAPLKKPPQSMPNWPANIMAARTE